VWSVHEERSLLFLDSVLTELTPIFGDRLKETFQKKEDTKMTFGNPPPDLLASIYRRPRKNLILDSGVSVPKSSTLLYSYDDPDSAAFFLPLTILLLVHIYFLVHIYWYAPNPDNVFFK